MALDLYLARIEADETNEAKRRDEEMAERKAELVDTLLGELEQRRKVRSKLFSS